MPIKRLATLKLQETHLFFCLFWNSTFILELDVYFGTLCLLGVFTFTIWNSNVRLLPGFAYQLQQRRTRQVGFAGEIEGQTDKKLDEKDRRTPQGEGGQHR